MSDGENRVTPAPRVSLRRLLSKALIGLAIVIAAGVALPFGCVGNRMFNTSSDDYLRQYETADGIPYAVAVVEFDDQGEPWDLAQLDAAIEHVRRLNAASDHGIVLFQFIHGWKSDAHRENSPGNRLAWFESQIADIANRSGVVADAESDEARPIVGLYIGWRGRTYSLPILIDASFWNRRVAAHRVASMSLNEVLHRSVNAAKEHPESKCVLVGHSMGGLVLERTLGPALVARVLAAEHAGESLPLEYDLVISANPAIKAIYSKQLIDILKRSKVRVVLEDHSGHRIKTGGPLLASITSEVDGVNRWIFPFAMRINSIFLRFRRGGGADAPSQRQLGIHTAGFVPALHSHRVELRGDDLLFHELPGRWNDTPFWVFQVPREISGDHSDISNPLWGRLMLRLMDENEVFDSDLELRLASVAESDRRGAS